MSVRRVVTGVDEAGRSTVLSDGDAFGGDTWGEVWAIDPAHGVEALADPHEGPMVLDPPACSAAPATRGGTEAIGRCA